MFTNRTNIIPLMRTNIIPLTDAEYYGIMLKATINDKKTDFKIKRVIFNNPATIVFWEDGTKTVVKAHGDEFDEEKGLAMAIAKRALGNTGRYYNVFKKFVPKDDEVEV